jgi:ring-1,2-phenylacetyl-CoA epoxidase subunit PaaB
MAVRNARDVYTRRQEGVSIWVVPTAEITASSPDE